MNKFPGYDCNTIDVVVLWNSLLSTWIRTDSAEIETTIQRQQTGACHIRIIFHSRYMHVDFPLFRKTFTIAIKHDGMIHSVFLFPYSSGVFGIFINSKNLPKVALQHLAVPNSLKIIPFVDLHICHM